MEQNIGTCLECGEKLIGRTDKKFCCDHCRNAFNNKMNKDSTNLMRNINNKLRKNYRILSDLNIDGKTKVSKSKLIERGFSFEFMTQTYTTKNGKIYVFVYDQGYLEIVKDTFVLVKREMQH